MHGRGEIRVCIVDGPPGEDPRSAELRSLVAATDDLRNTADDASADCLIVTEVGLETESERIGNAQVPVVLFGPVPSVGDDIDGFVGTGGDDLERELRWVTMRAAAEHDRRAKITRLHAVAAELLACDTEQAVFDTAVGVAEEILDIDICGIDVVRGDWLVPVSVSNDMLETGYETVAIDEGVAGRTLTEGRSFIIDDVGTDADANPVEEEYRSGLSVPIGAIGVFQAGATHRAGFDETDKELVELLMRHVESAVNRIRAESELRKRRDTIERLHRATALLVAAESEEELLEMTLDIGESILGFEHCYVAIAKDDHFESVLRDNLPFDIPAQMPLDYGLLGETYRTRESVLVDDLHDHPVADPVSPVTKSAISIPIGDAGVFQALSERRGGLDEDSLEVGEVLVSYVASTLKRLRLMKAMRVHESELVAERDRFSLLFQNIPNPAVEFVFEDGGPVVTATNDEFETVFGYDEAELAGSHLDEYIVPSTKREEAAGLNGRLADGGDVEAEVRRMTAHGLRDFLVHVAPVRLNDHLEGFAIYTDITEQKRRERQLARQNERLEEFAGVVSHDLRNPLTVAKGYLDLAVENDDTASLSTAVDALERMDRLIEELLTLAKEGREVGTRETVSLETIAKTAWETVDTKDGELICDDPGTIEADADRVLAMFENLFRNALEHGSGDCTIRVGGRPDGFYVEDDGPGIPAEDRESVFDTGYTTRANGTGFGLSIVKEIVDAHGWEVTIETGERGGARFVFETSWTPRLYSS